jgi:hypothetical protein
MRPTSMIWAENGVDEDEAKRRKSAPPDMDSEGMYG